MALLENLINVIVPLILCGLIFVYFRRRITNLEQSVDIMMKMIQTNELKEGGGSNEHGNLYVPSLDENSLVKNVEMSSVENNNSDSESDESDSDSESESENESDSSESESETNEVQHDQHSLPHIPQVSSQPGEIELVVDEVELDGENTSKTVSLVPEEPSTEVDNEPLDKDDLEKKNLVDLKKLLKEKNPSINNLSRMNKQSVIENLMNN